MAILTQLLFGLLILFLPSNLAFHLPIGNAIVQGALVDYLIPKIYLTDIFILGILLLSFARRRLAKLNWLLITFFLVTLIRGLLTPHPVSALWFWLKLVEMTLFALWVRAQIFNFQFSIFKSALTGAVLWQSLLALAQWLHQSSLAGYWFLGEPLFNATTPGIAKAGFFGSLKVLPYGTTPHPNVLAGFLAISLVLTWPSVAALPGLIALFLTQSLSAIAALFIFITRKSKLLMILLIILLLVASRYSLDASSLSRRYQLNLAAISMWLDHPLFGVGLNQFTAYLPQYTEISASTRFLQPVHNIYLLLLSETGLIGFSIMFIIFIEIIKFTAKQQAPLIKIPLLMLLLIGLVDHYPLTLQTGQLLTALAIGLCSPVNEPGFRNGRIGSLRKAK